MAFSLRSLIAIMFAKLLWDYVQLFRASSGKATYSFPNNVLLSLLLDIVVAAAIIVFAISYATP